MHPHIYHGFYCANVEPSTTTYRISAEQPESEWVVHQDYDDMLIYSASGFEHASSPWMEDTPRVTIAFDIFPESIYFGEQDTDYDWSLDGKMYQGQYHFQNCGETKNYKYMCYTKVTTYQIIITELGRCL